MLLAPYTAGAVVLTVLPLLFLISRCVAKRIKQLPWYIDDTLLVVSLVSR